MWGNRFLSSRFVGLCLIVYLVSPLWAHSLAGIYLTAKDTPGGQAVVEIFEYDNKYYVYGLKNLEGNTSLDSCNKHEELRERRSVGSVFAYDYKRNGKGELTGGSIYNFDDCKTYYGKIVPSKGGNIYFVGALDSYYILRRSYEWNLLDPSEARKYEIYRLPMEELVRSIEDTKKSKK